MLNHYAVTTDGTVRRYAAKRVALEMVMQLGNGAMYANDLDLTKLPTPVLVTLHNLVRPERPVTRFADRATAEKRLAGVLEVLSRPGEAPVATTTTEEADTMESDQTAPPLDSEQPAADHEGSTTTTRESEETTTMAAKKSGAKKSAAKKSGAKKSTTVAATIPESTVKRVVKMRADGVKWPEILKTLGEKTSFIHRIRPLMKKLDKSSVMAIGPGSPNYGKGKKVAKKSGK